MRREVLVAVEHNEGNVDTVKAETDVAVIQKFNSTTTAGKETHDNNDCRLMMIMIYWLFEVGKLPLYEVDSMLCML
jgi:hypothetical protein